MKNKINANTMFALLVCWIWIKSILLDYVRAVVMRLPYIGAYPDIIMGIVFGIILVAAIPAFLISKTDLIFTLIVTIFYLINWFLCRESAGYFEAHFVSLLLNILPLYLVGTSLSRNRNKEDIIQMLYCLSMITLPATILYKALFSTPMSAIASQYQGNMEYAYDLLPHVCLIAYFTARKTTILNIVFAIGGGLYLMLQGTRGAVLIYLIMVAILLVMGKTSKRVIVRVVAVIGSAVAFFASPLYEAFILLMYQKALDYGLSTRIFDKLLSGSAANSHGREVIREALIEAIKLNPLGYGLFADRVIAGNYAHNILIEFWVDFGLIVGTLLFFCAVYVFLKGYASTNEVNTKGIIMTLFFAGFVQLFLSRSYLESWMFFLCLGICLGSIQKKKSTQNQIKR